MELAKLILFTLLITFGVSSARAACTVRAEDPVISQFFRSKGFEVDEEKGDFRAEFEVTCEAIERQKDKFSASEIHQTTAKIELFNQYDNQKVVYHADSLVEKGGRVESAFVVPCADTREMKTKLLEAALESAKNINCGEEE